MKDKFEDGKPIHIFESGSILQYLADRYDNDHKISYPRGTREYYDINSWVSRQPRTRLVQDELLTLMM